MRQLQMSSAIQTGKRRNRILACRAALAAVVAAFLMGCNWVQVTDAGQQVSLAVASEVRDCARIGTSTANSLSRVGFIPRGGEKLQTELISLARNEAADMGGNRVVAESTIVDGSQTFGVYQC